jgi:hypothetical protein
MESFLPRSHAMPSSSAPKLEINCSAHFIPWLQTQFISLAFTTYQTNRVFFIGCNEQGRVAAYERLFDKPMGVIEDATTSNLAITAPTTSMAAMAMIPSSADWATIFSWAVVTVMTC